jgi:DNA-binding transcriptional LysR family regulator
MLDVTKLATLRAVVATGSFSAAAPALALTQPAVSRQVSALEQQVGVALVHRTQRGVRATEAGRLLLDHADEILARLALAQSQLEDLAGMRRGQVRLGAFFTALVHLSAELTARLAERHPALFEAGVQVVLDELVDRRTALRRLASGRLDLAIVFVRPGEPDDAPDGVELVDLFEDPPVVLLPAGHRLAAAASVSLADLAGDTWIRPHAGGAADAHDAALAAAGLHPQVIRAGHGDEPVEAQALVAAGRGVTLAHALNVVLDPLRVVPVALDGPPPRRVQAAVAAGRTAPATRAALEVLRAMADERRVPTGRRAVTSAGRRPR